jgi:hypothetical protein
MKKIYKIMTDEQVESGREYLPGVRISKNQCPTVDCHINVKNQTIVPGRAVAGKSLRFEMSERKYNQHFDENTAMQKRLKERKPVYSRDDWEKFAKLQKKYSVNARNQDLTAGHLPKSRRLSKKSLRGLSAPHFMTPGSYKNELVRTRSAHSSQARQHRLKRQESKSVIVEADTTIDGMPTVIKISELCTSFHDSAKVLTHGTSGLLVEATTEGGSVYGEAVVTVKELQRLVNNAMSKRDARERDMETFANLKAYEEKPNLFPTFETSLSAEEEMKVAEVAMANVYVSNRYSAGGRDLKVTIGHRHTAQVIV